MRECLLRILKEEARTWLAVGAVVVIYMGVKGL